MAKVSKSEPRIATDDLEAQAKEYVFTKKQIEYLENRKKELKDVLLSKIEENGEEDDKGNLVFELPVEVDGYTAMTKQRRVSRKINEETALQIIEEKGLKDKLIKTIEVVDEDALMAALYSDELTEEEIDLMYPQSVVWALVMNKR